jgi:hypothetical protein
MTAGTNCEFFWEICIEVLVTEKSSQKNNESHLRQHWSLIDEL